MTSARLKHAGIGLAALLLLPAGTGAAVAACTSETFAGADYTVCSFDLADDDVRLFWQRPGSGPFATFSALAAHLDGQGQNLAFAMNGGMYGDDLGPIGLYIENGETLQPANTASSNQRPAPNFYKKPNGIFYIGDGTAGVMTTDDYLARPPAARFATQSGPMLVIDGALHPAFIEGSDSLKPRNGICTPTPATVRMAITEGSVNFHDFGRFFRDHLGCDNALFLDGGSAPGIYAPDLGRDDPPGHGGYGPIIGVVEGG
ncbi:phosphodiester glycosidase family protein [Bauldia sp.]|uniref:phosphodiester glycosidase family protein n=1 Tax=Bauldia sp. TaxID=2575872 RepID=UPI003BA849E6